MFLGIYNQLPKRNKSFNADGVKPILPLRSEIFVFNPIFVKSTP